MARKENESLTFHNENTLLLVALLAKIVGWIILVIYALSWIGSMSEVFSGGGLQFPSGAINTLLYLANFVYPLAMGGFYFIVMYGIAQGLYVGLDLFVTTEEDEEEVVVVTTGG